MDSYCNCVSMCSAAHRRRSWCRAEGRSQRVEDELLLSGEDLSLIEVAVGVRSASLAKGREHVRFGGCEPPGCGRQRFGIIRRDEHTSVSVLEELGRLARWIRCNQHRSTRVDRARRDADQQRERRQHCQHEG